MQKLVDWFITIVSIVTAIVVIYSIPTSKPSPTKTLMYLIDTSQYAAANDLMGSLYGMDKKEVCANLPMFGNGFRAHIAEYIKSTYCECRNHTPY